jgi:LAO/AO transport system kinase
VATPGSRSIAELVAAACEGERAPLARLLSLSERGGDAAREIGRTIAGRKVTPGVPADEPGSYTVGITGAPGAGKSTLTSAMIGHLRRSGDRVAVLAVDPSSPFTGGAILGDRVRMQDHATDDDVFIRSMATRGHLGGLSLAAPEAVRLLAAAGWPWVLIETVGVGQVEVEIAGAADTTIVVVNPGWGDEVQAAKAGLIEIADVFVINKADRSGAAQTRADLEAVLDLTGSLDGSTEAWRPPVVECVATSASGVAELWAAVSSHRGHQQRTGALADRRADRLRSELRSIIAARLEQLARQATTEAEWDALQADVLAGVIDPWSAADALLAPLRPPPRPRLQPDDASRSLSWM